LVQQVAQLLVQFLVSQELALPLVLSAVVLAVLLVVVCQGQKNKNKSFAIVCAGVVGIHSNGLV
jgi:hypothetical protein